MKRKWKIVFVSVLVLIVLLVLISGVGQELETGLVRVETGSLAVTIREEGGSSPARAGSLHFIRGRLRNCSDRWAGGEGRDRFCH